jgi:RHS repeat-associated protein
MMMEERSWSASGFGYRHGFNGMEQDNEVSGSGNSLDFGARIYDSRLGRWMSTDPLQKKYPSLSPYNFVANSPILFIDPDGRIIDLGNLTPEQKIQYKAVLDKLSKS